PPSISPPFPYTTLFRSSGDHLLGDDVRPPDANLHVQPGLLVITLGLGRVVAGELRLGHPFQLERELRQLRRGVLRRRGGPDRCEDRKSTRLNSSHQIIS